MALSILQRASLSAIYLAMNALWLLESVTLERFTFLLTLTSRAFVALVFSYCAAFLSFSIKTEYLHKLAASLQYEEFYSQFAYQQNLKNQSYNVLGAGDSIFPVVKINDSLPPPITGKSAIVVERTSHKVLYEFNAKKKLAPASTTKLMTALVALDIYSFEDLVSASQDCAAVESTKAWLPVGAQFTVKDLITSMLVGSAGDSACLIASSKVDPSDFVTLMNSKALNVGMRDTNFTNSIGLDGDEGTNYSTASDLYRLSIAAMDNEYIKDTVARQSFELFSKDAEFQTTIYNTNKLLWEIPGTTGIKTGTTKEAGEVLIYEYSDGQRDIVIVVMGSQDRFADTKNLLDWTLSTFKWG
jgi:D-alanyl-D-alanine carboxypeptidase (penicillin-binding protein 5/6)